jgi:hypothetical protein
MPLTRLIARSSHLLIEIAGWLILLIALGSGWQRAGLIGGLVGAILAFLVLSITVGLFVQVFQIRSELENLRALLSRDQPPPKKQE